MVCTGLHLGAQVSENEESKNIFSSSNLQQYLGIQLGERINTLYFACLSAEYRDEN